MVHTSLVLGQRQGNVQGGRLLITRLATPHLPCHGPTKIFYCWRRQEHIRLLPEALVPAGQVSSVGRVGNSIVQTDIRYQNNLLAAPGYEATQLAVVVSMGLSVILCVNANYFV